MTPSTTGWLRYGVTWLIPAPREGMVPPPGNLFDEDQHIAERACFQAEAESKYWSLHDSKMRTLLAILRAEMEARRAAHVTRLRERSTQTVRSDDVPVHTRVPGFGFYVARGRVEALLGVETAEAHRTPGVGRASTRPRAT